MCCLWRCKRVVHAIQVHLSPLESDLHNPRSVVSGELIVSFSAERPSDRDPQMHRAVSTRMML